MESGLLVFLFLMFCYIGLKVCNTFSLVILTIISGFEIISRLAGAGQVVRSNLFLLGHNPFLAGQMSFI